MEYNLKREKERKKIGKAIFLINGQSQKHNDKERDCMTMIMRVKWKREIKDYELKIKRKRNKDKEIMGNQRKKQNVQW